MSYRLTLAVAAAAAALGLAGCGPAMSEPGTSPAPAALPKAPVNRWVLLGEQSPNIVWENGIAWDPEARLIVWHGGHIGRLYPQSNYTFLYDPARNRFRESQAPGRPQRRCLVHVAYLDGPRRTVTTDGGAAHGSIPVGGLGGEYLKVFRSDARGPWLYDSAADAWEDCRTLPPVWKRMAHAPVAYEPGSDALFGLREGELLIFSPRLNRVLTRPLPPELHKRLGYGLAADPLHRKLVVFGGSAGGGYQWVKPKEGQSVQEARREAYERMVRADTWVYDIAADSWRQCAPKKSPPRGLPMNDMLSNQMAWHDASGTVLLMQNGVDGYVTDNKAWKPAELWSFDVAAEEWSLVPVEEGAARPAFMGLLAYARELDLLFLFGGGRDGTGEEGRPDARPALSRRVWSCRVRVPGREHRPAGTLERVAVTADADGVRLEWTPALGETFEVLRAAVEAVPGRYEKLSAQPVAAGSFLDSSAQPGKVYAYRIRRSGTAVASLPAFNQPWRPAVLTASVESAREVKLSWKAGAEPDLAGYRVYRAKGAQVEKAAGELLTPEPIREPRFTDKTVDLSDGVICSYWVTAANRAGIESGASPLAYTAPDPPDGLCVPEGVGPSDGEGVRLNYVVSWRWPANVKVAGFNVYGAADVPNGSSAEIFNRTWKKLTEKPQPGREFVYADPKDGPACRYFFVRAVNVLGQEGFSTDIVSPTDRRFRP